uniref:Major facilitator superfamily (MFS) profile domain-containing protein n=1 Tax=Anopheles atroparvus TaxID=41427 RepID=A0AAG5CQU6_ANOAO
MGEESLERSEAKVLQPHVADYSPVRTHHQPDQEQDDSQQQQPQPPDSNQQGAPNEAGIRNSLKTVDPELQSIVTVKDETTTLNRVHPPTLVLASQNQHSPTHEESDAHQNETVSESNGTLLPRNGSAAKIGRSVSNSTMFQQANGRGGGPPVALGQDTKGGPFDPEDGTNESDYELVPPDGGWGWLVLAGSMLVNILVPGTIKSFGVLFVEFLEAFQASPSAAAWIPALCYFLYSSLGPLSSILSVKYSYRTVTIVGGTFAAVGMIITYWATSVNYLYVSYGVLVGTGAGLSFPPTVYIVTSYFVRLRGLANGLCISGSALGSIILPPVLRFLLETYGYRGACLIMGGITLNVWVAAIFYEPVEKHMKRVRKRITPVDEEIEGALTSAVHRGDTIPEECESNETDPTADRDASTKQLAVSSSKKPKFAIMGDDTPTISTPTLEHKSPDIFRFNPKNGLLDGFARSVSAAAVPVSYGRDKDELLGGGAGGGAGGFVDGGSTRRQRKISTPIKEEHRNLTFTSQLSSTSILPANDSSTGLGSYFRLNRLNSMRSGGPQGGHGTSGTNPSGRAPKRSPSTSSFQYMSTPFHGSTLSTHQPKEFASHLSLRSFGGSVTARGKAGGGDDDPATNGTVCGGTDPVVDRETGTKQGSSMGKTFFDLSLLSDPSYLVILISNSTNAIGYTNFIILLPAYAISLGFDKSLAAYLLSIVSTLDLVGRIGGSALSDTNLIPKTWYFVGGLSISGLALALLPTVRDYTMVSLFCGLFGLASGTYVGITAVIMADMLGTERLTSSYGISLFVNGILQLIGPPICGVIFERMGRYQPLFTALGFILLGGSALWGFMPVINRQKRRKAAAEAARQKATLQGPLAKGNAEDVDDIDDDDDGADRTMREGAEKSLIAA